MMSLFIIILRNYGKVLYKKHKGWNKPLEPSNDDFNKIGCEIVKYDLNYTELK